MFSTAQEQHAIIITYDEDFADQRVYPVGTHAGVIRLVLGKTLSIPDNQIFRLAQRYGAINRIRYFEDGPIVELMNGWRLR